jgi:hypothetical protein
VTVPLTPIFHSLSFDGTMLVGQALMLTGSPLLVRGVIQQCVPDTIDRGYLTPEEVEPAIEALLGAADRLAAEHGPLCFGLVMVELAHLRSEQPTVAADEVWPQDAAAAAG